MMDQGQEERLEDWINDEEDSAFEDSQFPESFAEKFAQQIEQDTRIVMEDVANIWMEMGLSSVRRAQRMREMHDLFTKCLEKAKKTEKTSLDELIEYKESKLVAVNEILSDLTLPKYQLPGDITLLKATKLLHIKYNELKGVKEERMAKLTELKSKRANLCQALQIQPVAFDMQTNIPSEEELMQLQSYVSDLAKEKTKRFGKYQMFKQQIIKLFELLERQPANEFEMQVVFEEDSSKFILSDENMKKLVSLHGRLEDDHSANKKLRKELESQLVALWKRLEASEREREKFLAQNNGCQPSILAILREEICKLEEIKKQNLERFTNKIRPEILDLYEKCCLADEEKIDFQWVLESEDYTEDLLNLHEAELNRLQTYFNDNEIMFNKLDQWKEMWDRYYDLEFKGNDPTRFNNRGGALLAEERERKQLQSKMPKLEKELRNMSKELAEKTGKLFTIHGMEIGKYFELRYDQYQMDKENEKQQRLRQKQMEIQANLKGKKVPPVGGGGIVLRKTPVKRTLPATSNLTNQTSGGKLRKIAGPLTPSKIVNELNGQGNQRAMSKLPVARPRGKNLQAQMNAMRDDPGSSLSINEDDFQAEIDFQSTFIAGHCPTPTQRHITMRQKNKPGLSRRKSKSCTDLVHAVDSMHLGYNRNLATIRSNPNSPCSKSATPSKMFSVANKKPPFIV